MPASRFVEGTISFEQLKNASTNYLRCLNLPQGPTHYPARVLIIADILSGQADNNLLARSYLISDLGKQIEQEGHQLAILKFDDSLDYGEFRKQTYQALKELNERDLEGEIDKSTTIVYLGEAWTNRIGINHAAEDFGQENHRTIKWAGSKGFSIGDARVLSGLSPKKIDKIYEINQNFNAFFEEKPQGLFEITTRGADGKERVLNLSYNIKEAPFESEVGQFDEKNKVMISKHVQYIDIPGGEISTTPYPFRKTSGEFAAEGILFTVENGLITKFIVVDIINPKRLGKTQNELITKLQKKEKIPVAELGVGFYTLAGIETYSDSSILSHEKSGPHIGLGHIAGSSVEEMEIGEAAGDFHHADFVLDNPVLIWIDPQSEKRQQFYSTTVSR